jgi:endoglucanase
VRVRTTVAAIVAVLLALAPTAGPAYGAAASAPTPVVSGNALIDTRTGDAWIAHAVNWPSFEYACQQGWAYASSLRTAAAAEAMASWGINAVRLPLNQSCWLGVDDSPAYGTVAGYRAAIADWVATLNDAGLVVILDLHWTAPAGHQANGQRAMTDAQSVTFWQQVAAADPPTPSVMFDLFNEPYSRWNSATSSWAFQLSWTCWRDGGCDAPVENDQTGTLSGATFVVTGMASLVAAVRGAGATQPILLGGIDYANDLRGWLGHRPEDSQLVASWHNYPGQRCNTASCWNDEIAPVAAEVPVIATEFGQTDGGNSFLTTFMTWADAHEVGYAPWAWWLTTPADGTAANLYALIADSDFTPRAPAGTAYYDHLQSLSPTWSSGHTLRGQVTCATPCRGAGGVFSPTVFAR